VSTRIEDEARAARHLCDRGYDVERPNWLPKGIRNPDFWATARDANTDPASLWVEVKSLDEDPSTAAIWRAYDLTSAVKMPPTLRGSASIHVEPFAARHSVERTLKTFERVVSKFDGLRVKLSFVQQAVDATDLSCAQVASDPPEIVWVRGAGKGKLSAPGGVCSDTSAITTVAAGGLIRFGRAFEFFEWTGPHECALIARLDPTSPYLVEKVSPSSGGISRTRETIAHALRDANRQIKAASEFRHAPAVVILAPQSFHLSPDLVAAACYGRLGIPTWRDAQGKVVWGELQHTDEAVFTPNTNRHISAVVLLPREGRSTPFLNRHCYHPVGDGSVILR